MAVYGFCANCVFDFATLQTLAEILLKQLKMMAKNFLEPIYCLDLY